MKNVNSLLSSTMMNLLHVRNGKKAYAIYALALFVFCSVGLVVKNFNDKIAMMSDSVLSYQQMIDKQSEQMKSITRERERFKRELAEEKEEKEMTVNELKNSITSMEERERQELRKKDKEISDLRDRLQTVEMEKNKVEGKYKTLSKANGDAVADIEYFKSENKKLRNQLHEASTSKTSEQLQLRDSLAKVICVQRKHKHKYKDSYLQKYKYNHRCQRREISTRSSIQRCSGSCSNQWTAFSCFRRRRIACR